MQLSAGPHWHWVCTVFTCGISGDVCAVETHFGDSAEVEVMRTHCRWNPNVEGGTQVEVDHVVRADCHVVVAMITWQAQISKHHMGCCEVLRCNKGSNLLCRIDGCIPLA